MERETDILHLLQQHQLELYIIGAVMLLGLIFFIGIAIERRQERRGDKHR